MVSPIASVQETHADTLYNMLDWGSSKHCASYHINLNHHTPKCSGDVMEVRYSPRESSEMKREDYAKKFKLPEGTVVIPFVIGAYGMWGEAAKELVEGMCRNRWQDVIMHSLQQTR